MNTKRQRILLIAIGLCLLIAAFLNVSLLVQETPTVLQPSSFSIRRAGGCSLLKDVAFVDTGSPSSTLLRLLLYKFASGNADVALEVFQNGVFTRVITRKDGLGGSQTMNIQILALQDFTQFSLQHLQQTKAVVFFLPSSLAASMDTVMQGLVQLIDPEASLPFERSRAYTLYLMELLKSRSPLQALLEDRFIDSMVVVRSMFCMSVDEIITLSPTYSDLFSPKIKATSRAAVMDFAVTRNSFDLSGLLQSHFANEFNTTLSNLPKEWSQHHTITLLHQRLAFLRAHCLQSDGAAVLCLPFVMDGPDFEAYFDQLASKLQQGFSTNKVISIPHAVVSNATESPRTSQNKSQPLSQHKVPPLPLVNSSRPDSQLELFEPRLDAKQIPDEQEVDLFPKNCNSKTAFAWIKTHRTYNSIFVNILNRHILAEDLNSIIPRDGTFIGWPLASGISSENFGLRYPERNEIDAFCCGTYVFNKAILQRFIPKATPLAIMREPTAQFVSTWHAYQFARMIRDDAGLSVTLHEYLESPEVYLSQTTESHQSLMNDIIATDFGLTPESSEEDVIQCIEDLASSGAVILMADYLFESLVLLKRTLCLDLSAVTFLDLRALLHDDSRRSRMLDVSSEQVVTSVRRMHWKSAMLFDHFNATFWDLISSQSSDFHDEINELKQLVAAATNKCAATSVPVALSVQNQGRFGHAEIDCELMMGNDLQFIDMFKLQRGSQVLGAETKFSCVTRSPETKVVWVKTHKTGSSTTTNLFHRFAFRHNLTLALPKDDMYYGWPFKKLQEAISVSHLQETQQSYDMLCSGHSVYDRPTMDALIPGAKFVTLLRHPIAHFLSSWSYWGMSTKIPHQYTDPLTIDDFLKDPHSYLNNLPGGDSLLIHNGMASDLGFNNNDQSNETIEAVLAFLTARSTGFDVALITEYLDESLIVLRRKFCWDLIDIVTFSLKVSKTPKAPLPPDQQLAILNLNRLDHAIYNHFNKSLWQEISKLPDFAEELQALQQLRERMMQQCSPHANVPDRFRRYSMAMDARSSLPSQCGSFMMDSIEFSRYFKWRQGLLDKDCVNPGVKNVIGLIKSKFSNPIADILTGIFYRRAWRLKLSVAIPNDLGQDDSFSSQNYTIFHPSPSDQGQNAAILANGFVRFDEERIGSLLAPAHGRLLVLVPNPVDRMLRQWSALDMSAQLKAQKYSTDMRAFMRSKVPALKPALRKMRNTFAQTLGVQDVDNLKQTAGLSKKLTTPNIIAVLPDTNDINTFLAYLCRLLCWDVQEVEIYVRPRITNKPSLDKVILDAISRFNHVDSRLYNTYNTSFHRKIAHEMGLHEEIVLLGSRQGSVRERCRPFEELQQSELVSNVLDNNVDAVVQECSLLLLDNPSLEVLFRRAYFEGPTR